MPRHKCPRCGSRDSASILYGLPAMTDDLERELQGGSIALGGCVVSGADPRWRCNSCETDFGLPGERAGHFSVVGSGGAFTSKRIADALQWAIELHAKQKRKGSNVPYAAHLLGVASLVLEDGGDEDEFIAALLHDSIEDAGVLSEEIERRFGSRVRRIVEAATDTLADGRRGPETWRERKTLYLQHLATMADDARRVALADKVHNARAMLRDYRALGDRLWERFNAGRNDQIWYYGGLAAVLGSESANAKELRLIVEQLANGDGQGESRQT